MATKKSTTIPLGSLTEKYLPADYSNVYAYEVNSEKEITSDDVMVNFWINFPTWVNVLFKLRIFLVKFVGLKSSEGSDVKEIEKCIRTGTAYRLASVPAKSDNETVLLLSDTHLGAYMSVYVENTEVRKIISLITLVHFKNRLGRIYFFAVRPFHGIAVKNMLKRAVNKVVDSVEK